MAIEINDERPLVKINARDNNKVIVQEVNNQVKISGWGPQGATGPVGPVGPQGPQGESGQYTISETAPTANVVQGDLWFRSDTAQLYFYYDGYWIETSTSYAGPIGATGPAGATLSPTEVSYTVGGGTTNGTQPTFNGAPMFYASYVKVGKLVHFRVNIIFTNITNFGTGQYYVTLPFSAKYDHYMRDGQVDDHSQDKKYSISGHTVAGSNVVLLYSTSSNGNEVPFTSSVPFNLATADNFHISGTYIEAD